MKKALAGIIIAVLVYGFWAWPNWPYKEETDVTISVVE